MHPTDMIFFYTRSVHADRRSKVHVLRTPTPVFASENRRGLCGVATQPGRANRAYVEPEEIDDRRMCRRCLVAHARRRDAAA